ncbi:hypothetical protein QW71_28735 [Paenibacillus sp. IHB B 3415]|uniref:hypothetical protein n=1 Tax=Paenibacillus sp. IHB B 3415 TaxID=867080 RepID=UPI000574F2F6|nr:hypothetical protein [Paenibacillus sp. IHB B 3415]KHL92534.1 hypothetical protein QW71_28735 [Paenibacillus sp. IHB B 3415]
MKIIKVIRLISMSVLALNALSGCTPKDTASSPAYASSQTSIPAVHPVPELKPVFSPETRSAAMSVSSGDKVQQQLQFVFNHGFLLRDGSLETQVPSNYSSADTELSPHTELKLEILYASAADTGTQSFLLASIIWPTNSIGSTLEQWLYSYEPGRGFTLLWSLADEQPAAAATQMDGYTLQVKLAKYGLTQNLRLLDEDIRRLKINSSLPNPLSQSDLIDIGTPTAYSLQENGTAPSSSWIVKRLINLESPPFIVGNLYTEFELKGGSASVNRAFLSSYANLAEGVVLDRILIDKLHLPSDSAELRSALAQASSLDTNQLVEAVLALAEQGIIHEERGFYIYTPLP